MKTWIGVDSLFWLTLEMLHSSDPLPPPLTPNLFTGFDEPLLVWGAVDHELFFIDDVPY